MFVHSVCSRPFFVYSNGQKGKGDGNSPLEASVFSLHGKPLHCVNILKLIFLFFIYVFLGIGLLRSVLSNLLSP